MFVVWEGVVGEGRCTGEEIPRRSFLCCQELRRPALFQAIKGAIATVSARMTDRERQGRGLLEVVDWETVVYVYI